MIAILSDIHGNRPALEAVFAEMARLGVRRFVVLGDVVGYGPFPNDCLRMTGLVIPTLIHLRAGGGASGGQSRAECSKALHNTSRGSGGPCRSGPDEVGCIWTRVSPRSK
ncbi:MAG: metallophosphoesterase [Verrucomicrobia bacterium]|nr:metallophosphoesterase [Verrucomicrobiota bacterium]